MMKIFYLNILIYTFYITIHSAVAQDVLASSPSTESPGFNEIIFEEIKNEYKKNFDHLPLIIGQVKGKKLKGSGLEIKIANDLLGEMPPRAWISAAKSCESVHCAFENLLKSKEASMQLFNIHAKSGYLISFDQKINFKKVEEFWTAKEIRELDAAINKIPKELKNLGYLKKISRMANGYRRSYHPPNVAAYAGPYVRNLKDAELVIYDNGRTPIDQEMNPYENVSWPQMVFVHELCHHYDYQGFYHSLNGKKFSEQKFLGFGDLSQWNEKTNTKGEVIWTHSPDAPFVSTYAKFSPSEDYAESCMNYILRPNVLEKKAPSKYTYMKENIFRNQEFKNRIWANVKKVIRPKTDE